MKKPFSPNSATPASVSLSGAELELKGSTRVVLADTDGAIVRDELLMRQASRFNARALARYSSRIARTSSLSHFLTE